MIICDRCFRECNRLHESQIDPERICDGCNAIEEETLEDAKQTVARAQMKRARREGKTLISRTKRGTVALRYEARRRLYELVTQDGGSWRVEGRRKEIERELCALYTVTKRTAVKAATREGN